MSNMRNTILIILILQKFSNCYCAREKHIEYYTNQWAAKVVGHIETATKIAEQEGFEVREIPELPELLVFEHPRHPKKGAFENRRLTERLESYSEVLWVQQISAHRRETRSITCPREGLTSGYSRYMLVASDQEFKRQWYMHDCRVNPLQGPNYDINVIPVWYEEKLLGFGIIVIVVDDGMETTHSELAPNYDPRYGLDLVDGTDSPNPRHMDRVYSHGTKCAGVIGMAVDNGDCGVGVAPMVTLGAVRLLGRKPSNDLTDSRALAFRSDEIHISSNSWGPKDDGETMVPMGPLTEAALKHGAEKGRKGKGVIYIFAGGNGKPKGDMCGCDPFVSSPYTIAVASCNQLGQRSKYSERCSAIMVTAYSGDKINEFNVISSDSFNRCTNQHSGTSAAAPLVAGGIALTLEANHKLTKRDIEYLIAMTAEVAPLQNNPGWRRNAAGFWLSHDFGFGLLNVRSMVKMAKQFVHVPPEAICVEEARFTHSITFSYLEPLRMEIIGKGCENDATEVNFLEHVQLRITLSYTTRGSLQINLISPGGTVAHLLEPRPADTSNAGIDWVFDSVHTWGESPRGKWTIEIIDSDNIRASGKGEVHKVALLLHGTREMPEIYKSGSRTYYNLPSTKEQEKIKKD